MGYTDWHIHTRNSDDCKRRGGISMEDLIRRTKELGVTDFGITDHVHAWYTYPYDIDGSYAEFQEALANHPEMKGHMHFGLECSVMSEWYVNLLDTRIQPEESTAYTLLVGMPDEKGPHNSRPMLCINDEIRKKYQVEYVIAGVHWGIFCSELDEKGVWDNLLNQCFFAIANPHTDIFAHWLWNDPAGFYTDPFYDFKKIPQTVKDDLATALRIYNTVFEVNSFFLHPQVSKHAPDFMHHYLEHAASLQDKGITLSFGSDSHLSTYPINFEEYYGLMEQHGIDTSKLWKL